tara:strand:- start:185 stop:886 length:702 start_codon:yes stop_codon:yes gene_type:complete
MLNNPILVLGSKPESILPKIKFQKIYAANGAAERSNFYKKTNTNLKLICVAGAKSIDNLDEVRSRIINSKPDKLVVRFNKSKYSKELKDKCIIETINYADQWNFQKEFFYNPNFSLLIGELSYKENLKKKIKKLIKFFFKKNLQGVSTGFFAILLALHENPNSEIVVSGIGMSGGGHFYKDSRDQGFNYDSRAAVDQYLISKLKNKYKLRIFSVDEDFVRVSKTRLFINNLKV